MSDMILKFMNSFNIVKYVIFHNQRRLCNNLYKIKRDDKFLKIKRDNNLFKIIKISYNVSRKTMYQVQY